MTLLGWSVFVKGSLWIFAERPLLLGSLSLVLFVPQKPTGTWPPETIYSKKMVIGDDLILKTNSLMHFEMI